ncbi:putative patatin/cPLA2 family phospholipase [Parabacteroides sp. PF5-5]|uniref:patatin-like phospholipase family protein n=1 Tax=unclassified Parabacteroides TaxID=2649774 RepID=UPI002475AE8D|nr:MULTISPECIES: patatin family protein [unclassified Parabacteroides]MDH6304415.1 putative patatin/cPLA2 family phospholipase [Parabacteroides sp. PH5-39]MDH6315432.1 putative patatin/cPLA2 family phospholipase [Parabacteroides sp. PF5-13]MDH6319074.1 putative patatin/cPLA2 family phospholipase [Parabacteroides sp. PH5-13]MDH6322804.1 putative patatin/cPLA2 family phospholipase [Parabacteroides sp. PH5-8]MDH6326624.1 putative patatin/cPLA2 family phospholipase [Parabacteroides sp. PH5-41]
MKVSNQTGLVLEGGGMRGVFTAGVLDYFMDNEIRFPYTIGVSAGASNGLSYGSWQRGRSRFSNIDLLNTYNYIGWKHFLRGKGIIDMEYLFNIYPDKYYPFDYDTFFRSPSRFVIVASNCLTGEAEYFEEKKDPDRLLAITRASCSMPVLCPITYVDGVPMVDGGVCDAIPLQRAMIDGYEQNVVVLTRNKGYRKKDKDFKLPAFIYRKYPAIREQLRLRYRRYNEVLDYIEQLESEGKITVIRPRNPLEVDRTEKDTAKLTALYNEGYSCAREAFR